MGFFHRRLPKPGYSPEHPYHYPETCEWCGEEFCPEANGDECVHWQIERQKRDVEEALRLQGIRLVPKEKEPC